MDLGFVYHCLALITLYTLTHGCYLDADGLFNVKLISLHLIFFTCAILSFTPIYILLNQFSASCMLIQQETKVESEEVQNNVRSEQLESGEQEMIDLNDCANKIINNFNDLTRAWSPMIAITFATECVLLISAGFALSNVKLSDGSKVQTYFLCRDITMILMLLYCISYILGISWYAEITHTCIKEFGSKVR